MLAMASSQLPVAVVFSGLLVGFVYCAYCLAWRFDVGLASWPRELRSLFGVFGCCHCCFRFGSVAQEENHQTVAEWAIVALGLLPLPTRIPRLHLSRVAAYPSQRTVPLESCSLAIASAGLVIYCCCLCLQCFLVAVVVADVCFVGLPAVAIVRLIAHWLPQFVRASWHNRSLPRPSHLRSNP